jgi:hypothetical protein
VIGSLNLDIVSPEETFRHGLPLFDGVTVAEGYEVGIGFWDVPHDFGIVNVVAASVHDILVFLELFHCDVAQEKKKVRITHSPYLPRAKTTLYKKKTISFAKTKKAKNESTKYERLYKQGEGLPPRAQHE